MTQWVRAAVRVLCGGDPRHVIAPGEPMQVIALTGVHKRRVRCAICAGEPAPAFLPQAEETSPSRPMAQIASSRLAFDWKHAAAGREPGSDDE